MSDFERELERKFQKSIQYMDMDLKKWLMEQVSSGMRPCDDDEDESNGVLEYYKDIPYDEVKRFMNKFGLTEEHFINRINSFAKHVKLKQIYDEGSGMEFGGGSEVFCLFYTPLTKEHDYE